MTLVISDHPNVKAYVGHAGLLGMTEAIYAGVPMALIPMYGDQYANAATAEYKGIAVLVEYEELNEKVFRHALDEIFNNTRIGVRDRVADLYASAAVAKDPAHSPTRNTYLEKRRPAVSKNKSTIKIRTVYGGGAFKIPNADRLAGTTTDSHERSPR
ncbi:hypothetical protein M0802_004327 [Mischocyttarus mexicanus]|nr:hypothetical protein M0802_004327 [Mischocyttarus mexicanus]